jgi:hypothetical protein
MTTVINMTPEKLTAYQSVLYRRLAIRVAVVVAAVVAANVLDRKLNK